ncbi:hypothetical protein MKW92_049900 [Papaver armeniacum]|nr:hypothetical protein MKW92_049900 [Papaver armeniacum]
MAESKVFDYLGGFLVLDENFWKGNSHKVWFTVLALGFILLCQFLRAFINNRYNNRSVQVISTTGTTGTASLEPNSQTSISEIVSDADLRNLINELDEKSEENVQWNNVVDKRNSSVTYSVKNCKPKDGPLKYLSVTVFENCSTEVLRDFYMDYEYRKQWDKMIVEDDQLQIDDISGVEMGRTIKSFHFPIFDLMFMWSLLLISRVFISCDLIFNNFTAYSNCIISVPGRNACEIKLVHQEDAGMNVEMAKLAFSKGIWSYVCKMDAALRKYSPIARPQSSSVKNAVTFMRKRQQLRQPTLPSCGHFTGGIVRQGIEEKTIANGLLLLGGIVCLSRGHSSLGAKIAMACILKKLAKHGNPATQVTQN